MLAAKGPQGLQCRPQAAARRVARCNVRVSRLQCRAQAAGSSSSSGSWDAAANNHLDLSAAPGAAECSTSSSSSISSSNGSANSSSSSGSRWFGSSSRGKQSFGSAVLGSAAVAAPGLGGTGGWGSSSGGGGGGGWGWNPWGSSSGGAGAGASNGPLFDLAAADDGSKPKKKKKKGKKKKEEQQQAADEDDGMDITESEEEEPLNVEEENRAALLITSDTQLDEIIADAGAEGDGQRHGTHRCVEVRTQWSGWAASVLWLCQAGGRHLRVVVWCVDDKEEKGGSAVVGAATAGASAAVFASAVRAAPAAAASRQAVSCRSCLGTRLVIISQHRFRIPWSQLHVSHPTITTAPRTTTWPSPYLTLLLVLCAPQVVIEGWPEVGALPRLSELKDLLNVQEGFFFDYQDIIDDRRKLEL